MRTFALLLAFAAALGAQPAPHWWEAEPLRIIDLVTSFGQMELESPAALAARKAELGYNAEHLEIMDLPGGLDDTGFFFRSRVAGRQNPDRLRGYLPEAHQRGIRVMIYFNVHWYAPRFAARHPDWVQMRENGKPLEGVYQTGTSFCVNSPWREWSFQVLRDLAAYPIDGVFYDGPIFFPETCYCRYCQAKYRKLYGGPLPSKKERRGRAFAQLLAFQARSLADFLHDSRAVLKTANPEIAFYMNGGVRGGNWATARLNRALIGEQDLLGSEGGFIGGDLTRVPVWKPGVTARLLETQSGGKPRVIFSAAGHKPWTFSLLPAPELRLLYAGTIANAASVWLGMWPFEFAQPEMQALAEMNRFLARTRRYYQGTRSEARVAIVWSDTTANFYQGSDADLMDAQRVGGKPEAGNPEAEFSGLTDALVRSHTPFDVLDDTSLEREDLDRYALLVLPNVACMSDRAASRLRDYVRRGGTLVSTFETSAYDETGVRRKAFALADVFGAGAPGRIAGPLRWDYMKRLAGEAVLAGLDREFLPSSVYFVHAKAARGTALLGFTQPMPGPYEGIPRLSTDAALIANAFGNGRSLYFSGDLGASIQTYHLPEHLRLAYRLLRAPARVEIENAPESVEVVLRSQENGRRLLLHLVNSTGEMTRPIRHVVPLNNVAVRVRIAEGIDRAFTLMRPGRLEIQRLAGGEIRFTIPRVNEYEVVVLEPAAAH